MVHGRVEASSLLTGESSQCSASPAINHAEATGAPPALGDQTEAAHDAMGTGVQPAPGKGSGALHT